MNSPLQSLAKNGVLRVAINTGNRALFELRGFSIGLGPGNAGTLSLAKSPWGQAARNTRRCKLYVSRYASSAASGPKWTSAAPTPPHSCKAAQCSNVMTAAR